MRRQEGFGTQWHLGSHPIHTAPHSPLSFIILSTYRACARHGIRMLAQGNLRQ